MSRRSALSAFPTIRTPSHFSGRRGKPSSPIYGGGWSETNPEFRAFVEANRPAVELIFKGAEQVDGISGPVGEPLSGENNVDGPSPSGLELGADRDDAYGGRAARREGRHGRRLGLLSRRPPHGGPRPAAREAGGSRRVTLWLPVLHKHLATWAADPRTTISQIRRALEEVVECWPKPEWDAFTLKIEYLDLMRFLDRRVVPPREQIEEEWTYRLGEMQLPIDLACDLYQMNRSLAREPERSRRVIRLLFANWLAHVAHPGQRKPAATSALPHRKADGRRVAVSRQS